MPSPRRRPATTAREVAAASGSLLLLFLLLGTPSAREDPPLAITSSALLVLDPDPNDPCFAAPQACVESCASVLRVDTLSDGRAVLTPSGPDYTLSCDTGFKSDDPSYRTFMGPRGAINVTCGAMTAHGFETAWPPPPYPPLAKPDPQQPALAFDSFDCRGFGVTGLDDEPTYEDGTECQSAFYKPDEQVVSAIFERRAYHNALCHPWHCPTPGCSFMMASPILVLKVAEPGSGRVQVMPVGRRHGSCLDRRSWLNDSSCTSSLGSVRYKILEGRLLNETATARPKPGSKPTPCPLGTCPRKIFVPPAPGVGDGGTQSTVKAGPRDAVCVSACDGGGKANATARAIMYPSAPPQSAFTTCPTDAKSNIGFACEPGCLSWQGPCCAVGSTPGPSADCPACPPGLKVDTSQVVARARLRLASIVAPNATVTCTNFSRIAEVELALAGKKSASRLVIIADLPGGDQALDGCPPRELVLSVNGGCDVELSTVPSSSCPRFTTEMGTNAFKLTLQPDGAAGTARAIKDQIVTLLWKFDYDERDRATGEVRGRWVEGNTTVAALEPKGPGGRGLLVLKLNPLGCIYRYAVVEGELPGASGSAPVAAAAGAGSPLPAAARYCPDGTTKSPDPAKLAEPGEPVPLCVMTKQ